jgi:hypothetical protein
MTPLARLFHLGRIRSDDGEDVDPTDDDQEEKDKKKKKKTPPPETDDDDEGDDDEGSGERQARVARAIVAAGAKARGETVGLEPGPAPFPRGQRVTAQQIIDASRRAREGRADDDLPAPQGLALQILEAGRKARGETP